MADKMSTLILSVDLECSSCYKKIRKVIAKFPEIQTQVFDEKNNKVIISGPFDPEKLKQKLCCKACKYIKDIQIKKPDPPPPPKQDPPKPDPPKPEPPKPEPPKPEPPKPEPPKPEPPKPEPPKPAPTPPKPAPPPPPALPVPGVPVGPYAPMVCCRPCYEGYPQHGICTHFGYERECRFFSEEDPSCRIM